MSENQQRITRGLDHLTAGLYPYLEREMKAVYGDQWTDAARESFQRGRVKQPPKGAIRWDAQSLLTVMWDQWNNVFRSKLGFVERSLVSELREFRNDWAHQRPFDFDDTYRMLDSIQRLLMACGDDERALEIAGEKRDVLREQFVVQEDVEGRRGRYRRERTFLLSLYVVCCLLIVATTFNAFGWDAWAVLVLVVASFAYFAFKLVTHRPRLLERGGFEFGSGIDTGVTDEPSLAG